MASPLQQVIPDVYNIHTSRNYPEAEDNEGSEACGNLIGKPVNQVTYPKISKCDEVTDGE